MYKGEKGMQIRAAEEKDLNAIEKIFDDIHDADESGALTVGWTRDVYPTRETAMAALSAGELFVISDGGDIVCSGIINQQQVDVYEGAPWECRAADEEVMVLHTLAVSPACSGKGYGSAFVGFYEDMALGHGCRDLRMDTNERNTNARALYKKLGYKEIDIAPCVFNGIEGVRLVLLEKVL